MTRPPTDHMSKSYDVADHFAQVSAEDDIVDPTEHEQQPDRQDHETDEAQPDAADVSVSVAIRGQADKHEQNDNEKSQHVVYRPVIRSQSRIAWSVFGDGL